MSFDEDPFPLRKFNFRFPNRVLRNSERDLPFPSSHKLSEISFFFLDQLVYSDDNAQIGFSASDFIFFGLCYEYNYFFIE